MSQENTGRKSASAFRTISEVSQELDVPQHVLRFWESRFSQVKPLKRAGRRRYYRPEDVALLKQIRDLLYHDGLTIKGVQKLFREKGGKLSERLSFTARQEYPLDSASLPACATNAVNDRGQAGVFPLAQRPSSGAALEINNDFGHLQHEVDQLRGQIKKNEEEQKRLLATLQEVRRFLAED